MKRPLNLTPDKPPTKNVWGKIKIAFKVASFFDPVFLIFDLLTTL